MKILKVLRKLFIAAWGDVWWFKHIQMCNIKIEWIRRLYILLSIMNSLFVSVLMIYWQTSQFLRISFLKVSLPWSHKITPRADESFWGFQFHFQHILSLKNVYFHIKEHRWITNRWKEKYIRFIFFLCTLIHKILTIDFFIHGPQHYLF